MKLTIELDGSDPRLGAVMAALMGTTTIISGTPNPIKVDDVKPQAPKAATVSTPKTDPVQEGNGSAASSDAQDPPKTTAPSPASTSAPSKDIGEIDLPKLQELAASLLQAGERRTLKSILDENGVKSLSTAPAEAYGMLFDALTEAVVNLAPTA